MDSGAIFQDSGIIYPEKTGISLITKCMEAFGQFAPESALQKILKRPMGPYSSSVEMLDILDIGVGSEELDAVAASDADAAAEGAL